MSIQTVLLPVFVQVALTFALLAYLVKVRGDAFRSGTRAQDIALSGENFPPRARKVANAFANQFEIPVMFFLAVIFGIVLRQTSWLFVLCAWLFVICRLAQAGVAVTTNDVRLRGPLFLGSAVFAFLMWGLIFVGVFFGTSHI